MQIGFLPKQQAELLNAILGYLASSYATLRLPTSKHFQRLLKTFKGACFKSISRVKRANIFAIDNLPNLKRQRSSVVTMLSDHTKLPTGEVSLPVECIDPTGCYCSLRSARVQPPTPLHRTGVHPSRHIDPTKE